MCIRDSYISRREDAAKEQIEPLTTVGPIPIAYDYYFSSREDSLTFILQLEQSTVPTNVELVYNWDAQSAVWEDTMQVAASGVYTKTIYWDKSKTSLGFLFRIIGLGEELLYSSCNMYTIQKRRNDSP